ncbi:MAG: hypothetical protein U1E76_06560 [Planctomycetota bacterium]
MILLIAAGALLGGPRADATASVWRSYDLSHLLPQVDAGEPQEFLLPYSPLGTEVAASAETSSADPGRVVDSIMQLLGAEFQYEGRSIQPEGDRLFVVAPMSVQQKVERILAAWEQAFAAALDVSLDVVTLKARRDLGSSCVVKASDADRMLASVKDAIERSSSHRLRLMPGRTAVVDATRHLTFVRGYDVEIAQSAGVSEPHLDQTQVGTRLLLRGVPVAGGMALALCLKRADLNGDVKSRDYPMLQGLANDHGLELREVARIIQSPDVTFHSTVLNTFVADGSALLLSSGFDVTSGRSQELVVIRLLGNRPEVLTAVRVEQTEPDAQPVTMELMLLDAEQFDVPRCVFGAALSPRTSGLGYSLAPASDEPPFAAVSLKSADYGRCVELVHSAFPARELNEAAPLIANVSRIPLADDQGDLRTAVDLAAKPTVRSVTLTLRHAGSAAPVAQVSLPVRLEQESGGVIGVETLMVRGYEVEVANNSTIANARTTAVVDGLGYWLRPSLNIAGNLVLDLRMKANLRVDAGAAVDLKGSYYSKIDLPSFDTLWLDERLIFASGQKEIVLGESPGSVATSGLSLAVAVD